MSERDPGTQFEARGLGDAQLQLFLLGTALAEIDEAVIITDAQLEPPGPQILFANRGFTQLTGYEFSEVAGQTPRILQGSLTDRAETTRVRRELAASEHFKGRAINYRKDGRQFLMEWKISPARNADGQVTHYIGVQRDVTEEADFRESHASLERLDSLGLLASGIVHDFNNVMSAIMSLSEELYQQLPASSPLRGVTLDLVHASDYAQALTKQLLTFSRKHEPKREDIQLVTLVQRTGGVLRRLIRKDIDLTFDLPTSACVVRAVKGQIEQIVWNLVVNACDAVQMHGRIVVAVTNTHVSEADALSNHWIPGNYALLRVTDNGSGMDERTKAHLFEPFFTTKSEGRGTGIGLASVRANVRNMNGMIGVVSEPLRGTAFNVYIPLAAGPLG